MPEKEIKSGFSKARSITKTQGRVFYAASLLLPREKQNAAYAIYALCKQSDESVDDLESKDREKRLLEIKGRLDAAYSGASLTDGLLMAFRYTVEKARIPRSYFDELLDGMRMDLEKKRYADFQELSEYCYKVAGVVGLVMLRVFDCYEPKAEKYAIDLGFAMQLTNIIRDVKEDWDKGRIYLPADEMERYGVEEKDIEYGVADYEFRRLMEFQAERARRYYEDALPGLSFITDRRLRSVILVMHKMYSSILDGVEQDGFNVFSKRFRLSSIRKVGIVLEGLIREYM